MIKFMLVMLLAIKMIKGACTSNTLGFTGGNLLEQCFPCYNYDTLAFRSDSHILGDFDSVFTNSAPQDCPVTNCEIRYGLYLITKFLQKFTKYHLYITFQRK